MLKNHSNEAVAECFGLNEAIDHGRVRDLVVVGAGPGDPGRSDTEKLPPSAPSAPSRISDFFG